MKTSKPKSTPPIHCAHDRLADIETLIAQPRNPQQHPEAQVALLAKIIAHTGWRSPVVVSRRSGFVVAGHGRLLAARKLGLETVPVNDQDFKTEADEWAHLIADNRLSAIAETDDDLLRGLVVDLKATEMDLDLTGFDADSRLDINPETTSATTTTQAVDFPEKDQNIETTHICPKCGYKWSGGQ